MEKAISFRSPKNKFYAEIHFSEPLEGIGSVTSLGGMTLDECKFRAEKEARRILEHNNVIATIHIRENKKVYPEFDWVYVERYEVK